MEGINSATFTRHGNTRPIEDDQTDMTIRCGSYISDSDGSEAKNTLLEKPYQNSDTTENSNLLKNDEVTYRKSCQSNSAERGKALSPRDDIDTSTNGQIRMNNQDDNSIDKKKLSAKKHYIAKRCRRLSPYTFSVLLNALMCVGLCVYLKYANITNNTEKENVNLTNHVTTHKPMFENLKVNFDLYNFQNNSGNIGWKHLATTFLKLDESSTNISLLQSGSYSIDLSLNFDNRHNDNQTDVYVCIKNSGDNEDDSCTIEVLLAHTRKSVHVGINLNLQKGNAIWVFVKGLNRIYQLSNGIDTRICVLQPGSYSTDVTFNLDSRRNKDQVTVSVCNLNSRDRTRNRCIPGVLPSHMQRSEGRTNMYHVIDDYNPGTHLPQGQAEPMTDQDGTKDMSKIIDENDTATCFQQGNTEPYFDQDIRPEFCSEQASLLQSSIPKAQTTETVCLWIDSNDIQNKKSTISLTNANSVEVERNVDLAKTKSSTIQSENNCVVDINKTKTEQKMKPPKSQNLAKQFKQLLPYIFIVLILVIFGSVWYVISDRNGTSQFVNLKPNFDLYGAETTSGKIPWLSIDTNFVALKGNGTTICILQPGSYSIDLTLNLDNRRHNDSVAVSVCILNSRDTGNLCFPGVLSAHMQGSVTASVNLNLQKGDTVWVSVIGLNLIYRRSDVSNMSIRKYDA
ncbi:unnamed protein product [Mytilus edulis]|uniref:Uncharacterized protein n=1 Tax=Mytilus edulis TaxID=6550 RepID=A0A8S3Q5S6_MYTED|nr:unnamed protein product [Mytilus edulis]